MTWVLLLNKHRQIFAWPCFFFALILVPLRYPFVAMSYFCFNVWNTGLLNCTLLVLYIFFLSTWLYSRKKLSNSTINFYLLWQFTLRINMIFYINTLKASTLTDLKDTHKLITLLINMAWQLKDLSRYPTS